MASSNGASMSVGSNLVEVKQKHTSKAVPVEVRRELWKVSSLVSHLSWTNGHTVSGIRTVLAAGTPCTLSERL